jgi:hypothetical protein
MNYLIILNDRDVLALTECTGFTFRKAASTLFWKPDELPEGEPRVEAGISPDAGFVSLLFAKE